MCNCPICNETEQENVMWATVHEMMEKCGMDLEQSKKAYHLVDEVASIAVSEYGSMREVVRNVVGPNSDYLPGDSKVCAKFLGYLAEVYVYNRYGKEEEKKPPCKHKHPDGKWALEYGSCVEQRSWDMYCTICKKDGTREELESDGKSE